MIAVVALWILLVLSVFSMSVSSGVRTELQSNRHHIQKLKSSRLARSGVLIAIEALRHDGNRNVDHLFETWSADTDLFDNVQLREGWFDVSYPLPLDDESDENTAFGVVDEDGKININLASRSVLAALPGMNARIADCVLDWRDVDSRTRPNGAEEADYVNNGVPYACANRDFQCVEELAMVHGVDAALLESLRPFVTVYGDSAVNVLTAPGEVLAALGLPDEIVSKLEAFREDERNLDLLEEETVDVNLFIALVRQDTRMRLTEQTLLRNFFFTGKLKFTSDVFRIHSRGSAPLRPGVDRRRITDLVTTSYVVEVVCRRAPPNTAGAGSWDFLYWREE